MSPAPGLNSYFSSRGFDWEPPIHSKDSVLPLDAGLNQALTGTSWLGLCVWRGCAYVRKGAQTMGKRLYYLGITPFSAWITVGSHSSVSISAQLVHRLISLVLAAVLIAQEETWFILPVRSPRQVLCDACYKTLPGISRRRVRNRFKRVPCAKWRDERWSNVADVHACN